MTVKILDAGGDKLMLSGNDRPEVAAALQRYLDRGSKVITQVSRVGQIWVAACTTPKSANSADETTTLRLSDIQDAQQANEEDDGGCRIENIGFKRMITGPSLEAVKKKVDEVIRFGGTAIGEIEELDGQWMALCDTASISDTGFRG